MLYVARQEILLCFVSARAKISYRDNFRAIVLYDNWKNRLCLVGPYHVFNRYWLYRPWE